MRSPPLVWSFSPTPGSCSCAAGCCADFHHLDALAAATERAFTAVTPDDRMGRKSPTSTALTIRSLRPLASSP
jgi:hypothetical protein